MLHKNLLRFIATTLYLFAAIIFHAESVSAQHPCDAFVNTCNVPSLSAWTVNDTVVSSTGQTGEPLAHTFFPNTQNPLQTNWYHWTAPTSGTVVVNTAGTNPNAAPPAYLLPFVIDTTIAIYTGATLTTLTRITESDDWNPNHPSNTNCTVPRPLSESLYSSCTMLAVTPGTTYHFQIDKLMEANPANNDFVLNLYYLAPTSANVSITGRAADSSGRGITGAIISLTDMEGNVITAMTNPFGYYRFDDLEAGQNYILEARSKQFQFQNNPRVIFVSEDLQREDFVGEGESFYARE